MTWVKTQGVFTNKPWHKSWLVSKSRSESRCRSARWWLAPRLSSEYHNRTEICFTNTRNYCYRNKISVYSQVLSNKYIYNRLSVLEYIVLWTRCVILVIPIANSRPGAPTNSDVAIVGSRWRHNCCHWLWMKERHTDKATTRYETYVMTYVATQSSLDEFPLWIRLDLDPDRVSSETRSGSKPSLESSLKSRLLVNMAPVTGCDSQSTACGIELGPEMFWIGADCIFKEIYILGIAEYFLIVSFQISEIKKRWN